MDFVREVARDNPNSGPGQKGRGFLGRVFAGDKVPGLSEQQNQQLKRNAFLQAGLSMLGAGPGVTFAQALAKGIMAGRLSVTESAGSLLDEQNAQGRIEERYAVLSRADMSELERWREVRRRAVSEGDMDAAEVASDVIEDLQDREADEPNAKLTQINGIPVWVNEASQTVRDLEGNKIDPADLQPQSDPLEGSFREDVVMPDGSTHTVLFSRDGQPIQDLGVSQAPGGPEGPSDSRLNQLEREYDQRARIPAEEVVRAAESVAGIRAKVDEGEAPSSADLRVLSSHLQKAMQAGTLRESSIEAIEASGGVEGFLQGLKGQVLESGSAPRTVVADLLQAIDREVSAQRRSFEESQGIYRERLQAMPGVTPDIVRATIGVNPFERIGRPDPEDEDDVINESFYGPGG